MDASHRSQGSAVLVFLAAASWVLASAQESPSHEPNFTEGQQEEFLTHAKVVQSREIGTGITHPWRLTLSDGTVEHDAVFQSVDVSEAYHRLQSGGAEIGFRDSYHFNIAAYQLAKLLGLDVMVPATVERKWKGTTGSLSWWVPWKLMEATRIARKLSPPDADAWNRQMYKVRVFDELVYDTDPNLTNVLITEDWKVWRIDFTRAFRTQHTLRSPQNLEKCDRELLERLRKLTYEEVLAKTAPHLTKGQVKALLERRDKIVAYFEKLIAEKGEGEVIQ